MQFTWLSRCAWRSDLPGVYPARFRTCSGTSWLKSLIFGLSNLYHVAREVSPVEACCVAWTLLSADLGLSGKGLELGDFFGCEFAEFPWMHIQLKRTVAHSLDLFHVMSDLFEHATDLAILAFNQCNFVPRISRFTNHSDLGR